MFHPNDAFSWYLIVSIFTWTLSERICYSQERLHLNQILFTSLNIFQCYNSFKLWLSSFHYSWFLTMNVWTLYLILWLLCQEILQTAIYNYHTVKKRNVFAHADSLANFELLNWQFSIFYHTAWRKGSCMTTKDFERLVSWSLWQNVLRRVLYSNPNAKTWETAVSTF